MRLAVAAMFIIATALLSLIVQAHAAPAMQRPAVHRSALGSKVAASATSFVAVPFPSPYPAFVGNVVFVPNGTAYFTDARNELDSFTPGGVYTRIPVSHAVASYTLLYADGVFWMSADHGIVKVDPDGSRRRWYPLSGPGNNANVFSIAAGPGGGIYAVGQIVSKNQEVAANTLFRIMNGVATTTPLSVQPSGLATEVFGPDKLLYFGYVGPSGVQGIARIEGDGSLSLFPIAGSNKFSQINWFVESRGNIYFDYEYYDSAKSYYTSLLGRLTPAGVMTMTAFPATGPTAGPSSLAVDKGGNLWVAVNNPSAVNQDFLYQFNVSTGRFNGPYRTGLPNLIYGGPAVAPDDDVWIVLPASSGANYFQPIGVGIFERGI